MAGPSQKGLYLFLVVITATLVGLAHSRTGDEKLEGEDLVRFGEGCEDVKDGEASIDYWEDLTKHIEKWQGIVLLICFGAFALFIVLIHRIIRTYIYYDAHLLDTFFDGGGDINFALIAASVVAKWVWTSTFSWSTAETQRFGLVGHFWFAAGAVIQLFLFAIVVCEIRIKAPGAKTYLQVVRARYGAVPHVVLMFFAFFANIMIAGIVMTEGTRVLTELTKDLEHEVMAVILAIVIAFFTVVGGVGGAIYVSYFSAVLIIAVVLYYMCDVFFDPLERDDNKFGDREDIYNLVRCGRADDDNDDFSALTFLSRDGMVQGILIILSGFSSVFVNQSFWQTGIAAKPVHSVWGFIMGGLAWFAIPLGGSYALGMGYWALAIGYKGGKHFVAEEDVEHGLLPVHVSRELLDKTGDFLIFTISMVAVVITVSGEVLAASSVIIYDIYQTYISPFRPTPIPDNRDVSVRMQRAIRNEEYLEYDRRCVVLKHVVVISVTCLLIPITLALYAIDISTPWLVQFLAVCVGSCVFPIALAVTWHRITSAGLTSGVLGGFICGFVAWLVYSALHEEINDKGLETFEINTGYEYSMLIGMAGSLGMGFLICVLVSLCCGGCDPDLLEEEEWEKTRRVDNPILPWAVKYAPDIGANLMNKGRPHFYTVRRTFKAPEIIAYIFGVLLAVCAVLVWPACMLTADVFNYDVFNNWTWMVLVWCIVALIFLGLVPLIYEIVQTCRQAYYNRMWARTEQKERLDEQSEPPRLDAHSYKGSESDFHSTVGPQSGLGTTNGRERWKTYITLE